jgi:3-methyladenine DNA glycosylase AlkD
MYEIHNLLQQQVNSARRDNPLFFKTGPGEYAEHDRFLGVPVPVVRTIAKQYAHISLQEINSLLASRNNEERLLALFILNLQYKKANEQERHALYSFYMNNLKQVNNWNLVDSSAHEIVGAHLFQYNGDKNILISLAKSSNLWERRIAIIAPLYFIRKLDFSWTFTIAEILLTDKHDLIHKAVGWMLREVGQKDEAQLRAFLDKHAAKMPRTMLRYAIEKFSPQERAVYMQAGRQ